MYPSSNLYGISNFIVLAMIFVLLMLIKNINDRNKIKLLQIGTLAVGVTSYALFLIITFQTSFEFILGGIYYKQFYYQFDYVNVVYVLAYLGLFGSMAYLTLGEYIIKNSLLERIAHSLVLIFFAVRLMFLEKMDRTIFDSHMGVLMYCIFSSLITGSILANFVLYAKYSGIKKEY